MKKTVIGIILLLIAVLKSNSQIIDTSAFHKLITKEPLPYKNKKGEFLGCGYTYECRDMGIVFYSVRLEKSSNRIAIEGKLFDYRSGIDSDGVYVTHIFLAVPKKNKLTNIRDVSATYYRYPKDSSANTFLYRTGDFIIHTSFSQMDKLYFIDVTFGPIEINIDNLFSNKKQNP